MSYADIVKRGDKTSSSTVQKKNLDILSLRSTRPVGGTIYLGPLHSNCNDCESCDTCDFRRGCTDPRCINGITQVWDEYVSQEQLDYVERMKQSEKAMWKRKDDILTEARELQKELDEVLRNAGEFTRRYLEKKV
jgi:hypothetical protein